MLPDKLIDVIKDKGYEVYRSGNEYNFRKYSSYGQDFGFDVEYDGDIDHFIDNIREVYNNFDVSYETYLWLDDSGHGKNGAPYDMIDVYKDMEECQEYIDHLYHIVKEWATDNTNRVDMEECMKCSYLSVCDYGDCPIK